MSSSAIEDDSSQLFQSDNGGVRVRMDFNEDYRMNYYQSNYFTYSVKIGSSLSILFTGYKIV